MTTLTQDELGWLCVCAVRYSLGRSSYAPAYTAELVRKHWFSLCPSDRACLANTIDVELQRTRGHEHAVDRTTWQELLLWCRGNP